jgi:hypothetical protein
MIVPSGALTAVVRQLLPAPDGTIILTFNNKTRRVSFNNCFTGSNCLTTAVRALDGTIILTFNSKTRPYGIITAVFEAKYACPDGWHGLTAVVRQLLPAKQ